MEVDGYAAKAKHKQVSQTPVGAKDPQQDDGYMEFLSGHYAALMGSRSVCIFISNVDLFQFQCR